MILLGDIMAYDVLVSWYHQCIHPSLPSCIQLAERAWVVYAGLAIRLHMLLLGEVLIGQKDMETYN